jgi:hypothetical protein
VRCSQQGSQRFLLRDNHQTLLSFALATAMVHVHELFRAGEITDDVEFANWFFFGRVVCGVCVCKIFAFTDIFGPLTIIVEEFQALRVFDKNVHG